MAAVQALAEAGLSLVSAPLFGEWSEMWGRQAAGMLLTADTQFDAVFCGSDQIARGVAETLRAVGHRVPDDVALVGFDNWDVMALGSQPPLTSLDMDLEGLGRTAADLLLAAINGQPAPGVHARPCHLVVRESTAIPMSVRPAMSRAFGNLSQGGA
jgi:LacI family transcriptional regulator